MNNTSESKWYGIFRSLTAITAAATVAAAFIQWPDPLSAIHGLLTTGAMLAVICIAGRLFERRWKWSAIFLAVALIFANISPEAFSSVRFSPAILALSFLFSLLSLESGRADHAADATAITTAAAFICPPAIWILIPQMLLSAAISRKPLRILAGGTAGMAITIIATFCIIVLTGGTEAIPEYTGRFLEKISAVEVGTLSFNGWLSLSRYAFILAMAVTVVLFMGCRTRLRIPEAAKAEYTIMLILSMITIAVLYGEAAAQPVSLLIPALSAFIIPDMMHFSERCGAVAIPVSACLIFSLAEIISGFIPEMNKVFAIFAV